MRVVIAGGHGQIAQHLERRLAERGDTPVGIVRNPDHRADLEANGAEVAVLDLEQASVADLAAVLEGADAVVFAAGAGPGSGAARKETVDRDAAVLLADAAEQAGVRRYVMVSAMGADSGGGGGEDVFSVYLDAKKAADDDVIARDLDWTVVRPGGLTEDPGTGRVRVAASTGRGQVPREDVAAVIVAVLDRPASARQVLEVIGGDTPVEEAVAAPGP
ncbi:SDR family oxidoreductase [Georgenia sp. H159]|uniref:SDR family oxidoreductase n=1 Tax=Georgenia sp. H159 TaxID=3076115 RepID=UPI002D77B128|nr:SDR family oxidoreductase [Georgenia sp. H159]